MNIKIFTLFFIIGSLFGQQKANTNGFDNERIGTWEINNGIFITNNLEETSVAERNWNAFYSIFPKKLTQKYIKRLVLISDGKDEKTGALGALNNKNDQWQLVIDPVDVDFTSKSSERKYQSLYTLIHEFGHLLTLNNTQIKPTSKETQDSDDPYLTFEGEALENSYINKFVKEFWSDGLLKEWDHIQKKYCFLEQESDTCLEKLYGLYNDNYTDFLTDYAAESPEEDIVESWTAFVLKNKVKEPETVADKKINFFYQFPELVKYRKIIRKNGIKYLK